MSGPFEAGEGTNTPKNPEPNKDAIEPIPQPPVRWFTKNLSEMDPSFPISSIWRLADIYGPIFKLDLGAFEIVALSSHELINEVCDEERFEKYISGGLKETRALLGDGLFTAYSDEPNWWKAHRILIPVFGPLAIRKMFPEMLDIASQMILKWDRQGPENEIDTADDFTIKYRLAFDTIGLCTFSYRFNDFYLENVHPFARQMAEVLTESGRRANRLTIENYIRVWSAEHTKENIKSMWALCDQIVAERKAHPKPESTDLLNTMLNATDPETGEKLSDENIRFNMVTFLVAGHETTSGTLSFLMYHLTRNPEKYHKAQEEVDRIVGDAPLTVKHLSQLKYLEACIRETLRFQGPINLFTVHPKKETVIGGKYRVYPKNSLQVSIKGLHHDQKVWGNDADIYRPERFLDGGFEALPRNAYKPFGNGRRSCIGSFFAQQEMLLVLALTLQHFEVDMADPSYNMRLKSTLTIKPENFKIKVRRRPGKGIRFDGLEAITPVPVAEKPTVDKPGESTDVVEKAPPIFIIYGSNSGTCRALAEELQSTASSRFGYSTKVETMDNMTERLPSIQTPVIIITPSYEGNPPDNARKFISQLEFSASMGKKNLDNVNYAVFGVGNSEWVNTYHRIPKLVDDLVDKLGGHRLCPAGFVDVREDITGRWEDWTEELWPVLAGAPGVAGTEVKVNEEQISVKIEQPETAMKLAGQEISEGFVRKNEELAGTEVGPAKRHMEVELPEGVTYRTGDYLVILPKNAPDAVKRVLKRFKLHGDDLITIDGTSKAFLASQGPINASELLATRIELGTPVSQRQLEIIAKTASGDEQKTLKDLASDAKFKVEILAKRFSVIDILEDFPSCSLSFAEFLDMMKPLAPRQFSISSSPLATDEDQGLGLRPTIASITYDVHEAPARSGQGRVFKGVASTYLATSEVGSKIRCHTRATNTGFHLPSDPETPVIMIAAGTGIAPMRGFIQERACIAEAQDKKLGPAILYFGCRDAEKDFIYAEELRKWQNAGVVDVRTTFSQHPEPHKYVPERLWAEREEIATLFHTGGAKIFVCGSASKLARGTNETIQKMYMERNPGKTQEDAFEFLQKQREERYVSDVFD